MSPPYNSLSGQDLKAVAAVMARAGVPLSGPLSSELIAGGRSNLTFRLGDGAKSWVLRMPPRAGRTPSAHDMAREYRITSALMGTSVPVPPAVALCEDETLIGGHFAVSEFVPGKAIRSRADLDAVDDAALDAIARELVKVLASLHRVDRIAIGLERFGRPDGYAERQLSRWRRQWELVAAPETKHFGTEIAARLESALPPGQGATGIVHGDYRIDNTIIKPPSGTDEACIAAVVDWELSTIGDPVADVAMMCAYREPEFDLVVGAPAAWTSTRLPAAPELATMYEKMAGVRLQAWDFHLALAYFKIAVIAAGIDYRFRVGAASGPGFDSAGSAVGPYLELSLRALGPRR